MEVNICFFVNTSLLHDTLMEPVYSFTCSFLEQANWSIHFYFKLTEGIAEEAHCSSNFVHSGGKVERGKGREEENGKAQKKSKKGESCVF
jgi:hypothetical protein